MATIEVDFDVFKELTHRRASEATTENDVIRSLLKMPAAARLPAAFAEGKPATFKGVTLPHGSKLRAEYKGQTFTAEIIDGQWVQDGAAQTSPSAAAYTVTGSGVNGWVFWSVKRPGDSGWRPLTQLRAKKS